MRDSTRHEEIIEKMGFKFVRLKSGRLLTFSEALAEADRAHSNQMRSISRAFKLATYDWDWEVLEWRLDHLESWLGAVREYLNKQHGFRATEERIAMLRNTEGRTPEEAKAYHAKADELERKLKEERRG